MAQDNLSGAGRGSSGSYRSEQADGVAVVVRVSVGSGKVRAAREDVENLVLVVFLHDLGGDLLVFVGEGDGAVVGGVGRKGTGGGNHRRIAAVTVGIDEGEGYGFVSSVGGRQRPGNAGDDFFLVLDDGIVVVFTTEGEHDKEQAQ